MLDDPRKPFDELLTPKNVYDRVSALETRQTEPSATVGSNEELTNTTGTQVVGNLLSPAPGVESTDPTDSAFTGSFMSGDGYAFNNEAYNMGGVNAGTLQWGAKQDDGTLLAGAGKVTLDESGVSIYASPSSPLRFIDEGSNVLGEIYNAGSAAPADSTPDIKIIAKQKASKNSSVTLESNVPSGQIPYVVLTANETGAALNQLALQGQEIILNYTSVDVDTIIKSDNNATMLVVDAGLDAVGIGGAPSTTDALQVTGNAAISGSLAVGGGAPVSLIDSTSFTPTAFGATSAGAGTYTTQTGEYYVIGNLVYFQAELVWTAHTGTGLMRVGGLPFTAKNNGIDVPCTIMWSNITLAAAGNKLLAGIAPNTQQINLYEIGSGAISNLTIDTAGSLFLSGVYLRA